MSSETQGIWVYGIVPAGASLETLDSRAGNELPEVSLVEAGDLAAIVSDRPADDPKATRDQALAHARVLEAAVHDASVVPFRFGIICSDDEEVGNDLLQARHDEFAQLLETVEGRVQMVLKVTYEEEALLREILEAEPEIAQLREA